MENFGLFVSVNSQSFTFLDEGQALVPVVEDESGDVLLGHFGQLHREQILQLQQVDQLLSVLEWLQRVRYYFKSESIGLKRNNSSAILYESTFHFLSRPVATSNLHQPILVGLGFLLQNTFIKKISISLGVKFCAFN